MCIALTILKMNCCRWLEGELYNSLPLSVISIQLQLDGSFSRHLALNRIYIEFVRTRCWNVSVVMLIFILTGSRMFGVGYQKLWQALPSKLLPCLMVCLVLILNPKLGGCSY